jgi:hypothetical protein
VQVGLTCSRNRPRFFHAFVSSLQHRASFVQERATGLCQADRFRRAFEQKETELIFKIANLTT